MTTLSSGQCRRCGQATFGGWTNRGEVVAMLVTVDAQPLDPGQELAAAVAGCATWTLHGPVGVGVLTARGPWAIRTRPAGTRPRQTVHATHVCDPAPWRTR